jgi:hypothetical protein
MPSIASPVASEAAVSSESSLTAKRDVLGPRIGTMSTEEAANRGFFRKGWNAGNATEYPVPEGSSALEKRQWTSDWNCVFNSGGMCVPNYLYIDANPKRP